MLKKFLAVCSFSLLFTPLSLLAEANPSISHVIYITVDGTRMQDVFIDRSHFPTLWKKYAKAKEVTLYGLPNSELSMEAASIPVSLPSYQTQMSGAVQPCPENDCGRIKIETFPEFLVNNLKMKKTDVVTFASWNKINLAVEHISGTTFTNIGNYPAVDPLTGKPDAFMSKLNALQAANHPELDPEDGPERFDKYTFAQAMHYYQKYQPRFMWISFVDADEAAHAEDWKAYKQALTFYDHAFDQVITQLKTMHLDKNTLVILTTDHGRGDGKDWIDHGPQLPYSKKTWAVVYNGKLVSVPQQNGSAYSTLSIRPTIEGVFKSTSV